MQAFQFWDNIWVSTHVSFTFLLLASLVQQYSSHTTSLSNLRLCNNISCLILITLTCHTNLIISQTSLDRYWSLHVNHEYLALNFLLQLCLPLWVPHKLTSFNKILEPFISTWISCSSIFLSHSSLSHGIAMNTFGNIRPLMLHPPW